MEINNNYQSYLLRMWKDGENGEWRVVLLSIPTQERRHFSSLEALFDFLGEQNEVFPSFAPISSRGHEMHFELK
jgi:hypothetical protein